MTKKIITIFIIAIYFLTGVFGIETYVGIKILDLKDSASVICINQSYSLGGYNLTGNYGPQGHIRALSSILPNYPIYFNLTKYEPDN